MAFFLWLSSFNLFDARVAHQMPSVLWFIKNRSTVSAITIYFKRVIGTPV